MADNSVKFRNNVRLTGVLEDYDLELMNGTNKEGNPYTAIRGSIVINTGDNNLHTIRAFYIEKFNNGNTNGNFTVAKRILDGDADGNKNSIGMKIQLSASFEENSFVSQGELVKTYQVSGGFLETNPQRIGSDKSEFTVDAVVSKELIPEVRNEEETGRYFVDAEVGNYRGMLYPVRFVIDSQGGIDYLNSLEKPAVLSVWGDVVNNVTIVRREEENAFGDPRIVEQTFTTRENVLRGASTEPREMTELLANAIKEGRQAYEVHLSSVENRAKEAGGNAFKGAVSQPNGGNVAAPKAEGFAF